MSKNGAQDARLVYSFAKNKDEEVHASLSTYRGRLRADLRVWVADEKDALHPTKKGISVPVADLPKLLAAVEALVAGAKDER